MSGDIFSAARAGDAAAVAALLRDDSGLAKSKGGPRKWEPLLYVCFEGTGSRTETARVLLAHGADPNAFYISEQFPDCPLSCLYGACGLKNDAELGRVLLEAGANPNDGESLYHSTEHVDMRCVPLLLEFGAEATIALNHMLDGERVYGLRMLLDAGADPNKLNGNGDTSLHWAVWRARSVECLRMLLDAGADMEAKRKDGRTAYALALRTGQLRSAEFLEQRGADTSVMPIDRFMGDCAQGRIDTQSEFLTSAEAGTLVVDCVKKHETDVVRRLLDAGVAIDARGELGGTALHWACWYGYDDLVDLLLARGAPTDVHDLTFNGVPAGWYDHGRQNCHENRGDYAATGRVLVRYGIRVP